MSTPLHATPASTTRRLERIAVTGRFQPIHFDHLALLQHAFAQARHVVIGITNPQPAVRTAHPASPHRHLAEANPWTYDERAELIDAALRCDGVNADRYSILPFPLDEPTQWPALLPPGTPQLVRVFSDWEREKVRRFAAAGYPPQVLEGDPATRLSASDIRSAMQNAAPWQHWVPLGARERLADWQRSGT